MSGSSNVASRFAATDRACQRGTLDAVHNLVEEIIGTFPLAAQLAIAKG
jgi:hypothetical protein